MTELNIKKEIGKRILEARKAKGLTLKALGELTGGLKQTRLTNWEQGVRTPGPEEIKSLARALDVSPAYLMCLSDEKLLKKLTPPSRLIPLLNHHQACNALLHIKTIQEQEDLNNITLIPVSLALLPDLSPAAFSLKMLDDSMTPEIRINDIQVIDPNAQVNPGDYVAVKISGKEEAFICLYKKLSYTLSEFELLTLNDNWPNLKFNADMEVKIIGKVVQNIRGY
ncbi:TPA: helix-turn-helix domain-containing protein [Legionella pneumophila]|nr:helix-turn-helix domain-containing protein [Legionella pneumophila]